MFEHRIEGSRTADLLWGTSAAKDAVVRFGFSGPAGTYAAVIRNQASDRSYIREFTVSGGDANTDTVQTVTFPGDTSGTWDTDNTLSHAFSVVVATGTTFHTTANAWQAGNFIGTSATTNGMGTVDSVFELFDVGLYADPESTGVAPPFELPHYDADLVECERYWILTGSQATGTWVASSPSTVPRVTLGLRTAMRVVPTAALTTTSPIFENWAITAHTGSGSTILFNSSTVRTVEVTLDGFTGPAATSHAYMRSDNLTLNARM